MLFPERLKLQEGKISVDVIDSLGLNMTEEAQSACGWLRCVRDDGDTWEESVDAAYVEVGRVRSQQIREEFLSSSDSSSSGGIGFVGLLTIVFSLL